ncbi:MAG: class I SAM-dependent methyltransferase [Nitrosomonadaceae bacterium]|nr:class I SAM-dependent methyltransferase [Nitrosomonadaceae bacterium]
MPFSYSNQLSAIVGFAEQQNPESILDIGIGMGQYGFLLRTNLENVNLFEIDGSNARQRSRDQWKVRIDGIEGFAGYITPVHEYSYTNLFIGEALKLLPALGDKIYDLVLAIDILEHFDKEQGVIFLRECRRVCKGSVLVSTPKEFIEQEVLANPLEDHRSHWTEEDLKLCGFDHFLPNPLSLIAIANNKSE